MKKTFRNEILDAPIYKTNDFPGIKLNQNESPWDIPLELKVAITEKLIKTDFNRYPKDKDILPIKEHLADTLNVTPQNITVANGTNSIVQALINIISHTGKVLLLDPSFSYYEYQAKLAGKKIVKVPLSEDFELLTERTLTVIKKEKPALIIIANPNSPTGTLFDKKSLYRIIQSSVCPVVIDESFFFFTAETVVDWLEEFDNLIILRTLSKAMALAGVRFGYAISHQDNILALDKFLPPYRVSTISAVIVNEILKSPHYIDEYTQNIISERGRLFSKLQTIEGIRVFPSEANFLLIRMDKADKVAEGLLKENIVVKNVNNNASLKDCLRISIGTPEQNEALLLTIKKVKNDVKDDPTHEE